MRNSLDTIREAHDVSPRWQTALPALAGALCVMLLANQRGSAACLGGQGAAAELPRCAGAAPPRELPASIDRGHAYTLAELINIAEVSHPNAQIYWERALQRSRETDRAESDNFPTLTARMTTGDDQSILPFPKPFAPTGYVVLQTPTVVPELSLQYLLLDLGRQARIDGAKAAAAASSAQLVRADQAIAYQVAVSFYGLVTRQEALEAARQILKTATVTQEAAEAQLANGRATEPDVLDARAASAQASFDLQSAMGDETIAHIALTEAIGAEPSPDIQIVRPKDSDLPAQVALRIDQLIDRAIRDRPDLQASFASLRGQAAAVHEARDAYFPTIALSAAGGYTLQWPTSPGATLGPAKAWTWTAHLDFQWLLFDGGARQSRLEEAESRNRETEGVARDTHDRVVSEVWTAYVAFQTALRKDESAVALVDAASASYAASLDAYNVGVKRVVDVVTTQKQLALARLSRVAARSELLVDATNLELVTGNLLGGGAAVTRTGAQGGDMR